MVLLKTVLRSKLCHNFIVRRYSLAQVEPIEELYYFHRSFPPEKISTILKNFTLYQNFVSASEEEMLVKEIEPRLRRMRYQFDHWDDAIHGFKETELLNWSNDSNSVLNKLRNLAFPSDMLLLPHTHVLDLAEDGHIKPHIDSIRFCGDIISGMSLLSDSVMRLVHKDFPGEIVDILLKKRSLYIMKDSARYEYTHEILPNSSSVFNNKKIKKTRRISIICRSEPCNKAVE